MGFPMPDAIPGVVLCKGGWFAVLNKSDTMGSGPWKTKGAAEAMLKRDVGRAHQLDAEYLRKAP